MGDSTNDYRSVPAGDAYRFRTIKPRLSPARRKKGLSNMMTRLKTIADAVAFATKVRADIDKHPTETWWQAKQAELYADAAMLEMLQWEIANAIAEELRIEQEARAFTTKMIKSTTDYSRRK